MTITTANDAVLESSLAEFLQAAWQLERVGLVTTSAVISINTSEPDELLSPWCQHHKQNTVIIIISNVHAL